MDGWMVGETARTQDAEPTQIDRSSSLVRLFEKTFGFMCSLLCSALGRVGSPGLLRAITQLMQRNLILGAQRSKEDPTPPSPPPCPLEMGSIQPTNAKTFTQ